MKIYSAAQVREWDGYTITHEPVSSIDLMERASLKAFGWIRENGLLPGHFLVLCGKGNNGGDGLAIARMLSENNCRVQVMLIGDPETWSADLRINFARLPLAVSKMIITGSALPDEATETINGLAGNNMIVIDALFGSGLNKPPEGIYATLIRLVNEQQKQVISIDLPSGLYTDTDSTGHDIIRATCTLSFQSRKLASLLPSNAGFIGQHVLLDIGLDSRFEESAVTPYELVDETLVKKIYRPRRDDAHKGTNGHVLLIAGSYGKMGAAVLAASACLRAGAGLLTCHIPASGYTIMQQGLPEAMVLTDYNSSFNTKFEGDFSIYKSIGIGPGIGTARETAELLHSVMESSHRPLVLDADALNIIGADKHLLRVVPPGSVLTPHPKEFERLFGETASDTERLQLALDKAAELDSVIILKGHHTFIATPSGKGYFNQTGNSGLAKGGTGDTLTGIVTALLAQRYTPAHAAILAVYLHGLTADLIVSESQSRESMLASDLIASLGKAFNRISSY
ncbi:MAG: NAD(P)H-hydrate dehydratase [Chitinophagaceae bacterium]|nr:MAG: NAD(P)H-hydrate dehydratase [Chitinophagaceae bacterium]